MKGIKESWVSCYHPCGWVPFSNVIEGNCLRFSCRKPGSDNCKRFRTDNTVWIEPCTNLPQILQFNSCTFIQDLVRFNFDTFRCTNKVRRKTAYFHFMPL